MAEPYSHVLQVRATRQHVRQFDQLSVDDLEHPKIARGSQERDLAHCIWRVDPLLVRLWGLVDVNECEARTVVDAGDPMRVRDALWERAAR